jgi:hypothetical protein
MMGILNRIRFVLFSFKYSPIAICLFFIKKLHLCDSEGRLLKRIGPTSAECRQILIKDLTKGVYFYILEIKLANSNKSLYSKSTKIECGRESSAPTLLCDFADLNNRKQLVIMAYHLINIRDK